jgi:hypothetical protein
LAQGNDIYALAIDLHFEMIDTIVIFKHLARNLAVAFTQGVHCTLKSPLGLAT